MMQIGPASGLLKLGIAEVAGRSARAQDQWVGMTLEVASASEWAPSMTSLALAVDSLDVAGSAGGWWSDRGRTEFRKAAERRALADFV